MVQTAYRIETNTEKNYIVNSRIEGEYLNQITYSTLVHQYVELSKLLLLKIWHQLRLETEVMAMNRRKAEKILYETKNDKVNYHPRLIKKAWSISLHENYKREKNQFLANNSWS